MFGAGQQQQHVRVWSLAGVGQGEGQWLAGALGAAQAGFWLPANLAPSGITVSLLHTLRHLQAPLFQQLPAQKVTC